MRRKWSVLKDTWGKTKAGRRLPLVRLLSVSKPGQHEWIIYFKQMGTESCCVRPDWLPWLVELRNKQTLNDAYVLPLNTHSSAEPKYWKATCKMFSCIDQTRSLHFPTRAPSKERVIKSTRHWSVKTTHLADITTALLNFILFLFCLFISSGQVKHNTLNGIYKVIKPSTHSFSFHYVYSHADFSFKNVLHQLTTIKLLVQLHLSNKLLFLGHRA